LAKFAPEKDIQRIRDNANIIDVVSKYVSLKPSGPGQMKGLCPFHDEKTPSFNVNSNNNMYYCFGCQEGGDAIKFIQKVTGCSFQEALENLSVIAGVSIDWQTRGEKRGAQNTADSVHREKIIQVNKAAEDFYAEQFKTEAAALARDQLFKRNFTMADCEKFNCGYAPYDKNEWGVLVKYLSNKGFSRPEIEAAGLGMMSKTGNMIDKFRNRLMWPIKDIGKDKTVGFTGRALDEEGIKRGKYVNTRETKAFKKHKALFGINLADKHIRSERQVVVVEGQTDVMAMHAAGVETAVASSGTAFTRDHIMFLNRLMGDSGQQGIAKAKGKMIFTFDGDKAGLHAALATFEKNEDFAAQSYVVIVPEGLDPCDYRIKYGDTALQNLVKSAIPMYEFALTTIINGFDLQSLGGRSEAIKAIVPVIKKIKDPVLRDGCIRLVKGETGADDNLIDQLLGSKRLAVNSNYRQGRNAGRNAGRNSGGNYRANQNFDSNFAMSAANYSSQAPFGKSIVHQSQSSSNFIDQLLAIAIQFPSALNSEEFMEINPIFFTGAAKSIFSAIEEVGGLDIGAALEDSKGAWIQELANSLKEAAGFVEDETIELDPDLEERRKKIPGLIYLAKLSTLKLPVDNLEEIRDLGNDYLHRLLKKNKQAILPQLKQKLKNLEYGSKEYKELFQKILSMSR
jgi:DNA primase